MPIPSESIFRQYIQEDQLSELLQLLKEQDDLPREALIELDLLLQKHQEWQKMVRQKLLTNEEKEVEKNRLTKRIIAFQQTFAQAEPNSPKQPSLVKKYEVQFVVIILISGFCLVLWRQSSLKSNNGPLQVIPPVLDTTPPKEVYSSHTLPTSTPASTTPEKSPPIIEASPEPIDPCPGLLHLVKSSNHRRVGSLIPFQYPMVRDYRWPNVPMTLESKPQSNIIILKTVLPLI